MPTVYEIIRHVARSENATMRDVQARYTDKQIGLIYYIDSKATKRKLDFASQLNGARVGQHLGEIFAQLF